MWKGNAARGYVRVLQFKCTYIMYGQLNLTLFITVVMIMIIIMMIADAIWCWLFWCFANGKYRIDRTRQGNYHSFERLGSLGTLVGLFGLGRPLVDQGSCRSSLFGLCRRLLFRLVGLRRRHGQCPTFRGHHFLFSIRLRLGILCLSHDDGRDCRRFVENGSGARIRVDLVGSGRLGSGLFVEYEGLVRLYWTIYHAQPTIVGRLSRLIFLYLFGVDDSIVLKETCHTIL